MQHDESLDNFTIRWDDWPMLALLGACYAGLVLLCLNFNTLPLGLSISLGAGLVCLFGSLQHEAVHGHPSRHRLLNEALVFLPFNLWVPYRRYRSLHLKHHRREHLTDPYEDPESFYLDPQAWRRAGRLQRCLFNINNTLAGRLMLGPALSTMRFLTQEWRLVRKGRCAVMHAWALHLTGLGLVYVIVTLICGMPFWAYAACCVYPGLSLTLLRSYAEHRAHDSAGCRSVIIESGPILSLLFLNNNLHAIHHDRPALAWHRLPGLYRQRRAHYQTANCHYVIAGYRSLVRRYMFKAKEPVQHPLLAMTLHDDTRS